MATTKSKTRTSLPALASSVDHAALLSTARSRAEAAKNPEAIEYCRKLADRWNAGDYTCKAEIEKLHDL